MHRESLPYLLSFIYKLIYIYISLHIVHEMFQVLTILGLEVTGILFWFPEREPSYQPCIIVRRWPVDCKVGNYYDADREVGRYYYAKICPKGSHI